MLNQVRLVLVAILALVLLCPVPGLAKEPAKGQTVYVPAYSYVYHGPKTSKLLVTTTLGVHNVNLTETITLSEVNYHDTDGVLVKKLLATPIEIPPLATREFIVPLRDVSGGSGANFIVVWNSPKLVKAPIIEALIIGTSNNQGISLVTQGKVINSVQ